MTVAELRIALAALPPYMPVMVYQRSCGEHGADDEPLVKAAVNDLQELVLHIYDDASY